jgi:hypothetical protein
MAETPLVPYTGGPVYSASSVYPQLRPDEPRTRPYYGKSFAESGFVASPEGTFNPINPTTVGAIAEVPEVPEVIPAPAKKGFGSSIKSFFRAIVAPGNVDFSSVESNVASPVLISAPSALPTAPPTSYQEENGPTEVRVFNLFQEIRSHAPVDRLQRATLDVRSLQNAGIDLSVFYDAGYSLKEMKRMFLQYEDLRELGLNKHFFGQKWSIKEFGELYQIKSIRLVSELQLTPIDLCNNKFTAAEIGAMGLTASHLINAGADFQFWVQLRASPGQFSEELKGTIVDVVNMKLNDVQKRALGTVCYWQPTSVMAIPGFDSTNVVKLWYGFDLS